MLLGRGFRHLTFNERVAFLLLKNEEEDLIHENKHKLSDWRFAGGGGFDGRDIGHGR
jgi:hypothetical protein